MARCGSWGCQGCRDSLRTLRQSPRCGGGACVRKARFCSRSAWLLRPAPQDLHAHSDYDRGSRRSCSRSRSRFPLNGAFRSRSCPQRRSSAFPGGDCGYPALRSRRRQDVLSGLRPGFHLRYRPELQNCGAYLIQLIFSSYGFPFRMV